jgi:hypothetical protein
MQKAGLAMLGIWLAGASLASAQDLPEGMFASSEAGCALLKAQTAEDLGEELDFYVLNRSGITTYMQRCEFVQVTPREGARWLATAICDDGGYIYPDLFTVAQKTDGGLAVTRLTDLTQQESPDAQDQPSLADDMNPVELGRDPAEDEEEEPEQSEAETKPDAFNHYVPCSDVKPSP